MYYLIMFDTPPTENYVLVHCPTMTTCVHLESARFFIFHLLDIYLLNIPIDTIDDEPNDVVEIHLGSNDKED